MEGVMHSYTLTTKQLEVDLKNLIDRYTGFLSSADFTEVQDAFFS